MDVASAYPGHSAGQPVDHAIPLGKPRPPLCVDLDGSLLASDVLWESVLQLLKREPWIALRFPFWLWRGKAHLKRQIASRVDLDPAHLPYRSDVLAYLHEQRAAGRTLVLATATDVQTAQAIADRLGIFSEVIGSDGCVNLAAGEKCRALESRFGHRQFDYLGNGFVDLPVWEAANAALLVSPSPRLLQRIAAPIAWTFTGERRLGRTLARALRVQQWSKNLLIFVPLLTAHVLFEPAPLRAAVLAFVAFCLCASGVYVMNDLLDLAADRQHPRKRLRPFAAGELPLTLGIALVPLLFSMAGLLAVSFLPPLFAAALLLYVAVTTSYSTWLKGIVLVDVIVLASLYSLRLLAGGLAAAVPISEWLLAFSMFLFLSLAFMKRFAEVGVLGKRGQTAVAGRGYVGTDREWLGTMGSMSGFLSVLVFAQYISSESVRLLYGRPQILWLACPLILYWIARMWVLAYRGRLEDDPIIETLRDSRSYFAGLLLAGILFAAL